MKKTFPVLILALSLLYTTPSFAWWWWWGSAEEKEPLPEVPADAIFAEDAPLDDLLDQVIEEFEERYPQYDFASYQGEAIPSPEKAEVFEAFKEALQEAFSYWTKTCVYHKEIYKPFLWQAFSATNLLTNNSEELLFLQTTPGFSVQLRPFFTHQKTHASSEACSFTSNQWGGLLTLRSQTPTSFLSTHFLFSRFSGDIKSSWGSFPMQGQNVIVSLAGGYLQKTRKASLQLSGGVNFTDLDLKFSHSKPKLFFLSLSPLLVMQKEAAPLSFFLGGEGFLGCRPTFRQKGEICHLSCPSLTTLLWKIKGGPAYTFQRKTQSRLHQLLLSFAVNIHSKIPVRTSYSPKIFFLSQDLQKKGGWSFSLVADLSTSTQDTALLAGFRW